MNSTLNKLLLVILAMAIGAQAAMHATAPVNPNHITAISKRADQVSFGDNHAAVLAHAIAGGIAVLIVIPIAVLVPRYARGLTRSRWWYKIHAGLNGGLALLLIVVAVGVAGSQFHRDFNTPHRGVGLFMVILIIAQSILGGMVHRLKARPNKWTSVSGRGIWNFVHMGLGGICMLVGWATAFTGIQDEWPRWSETGSLPQVWLIVAGVLVGIAVLLYAIGLVGFLPRQLRMEREARETKTGTSSPDIPLRDRA